MSFDFGKLKSFFSSTLSQKGGKQVIGIDIGSAAIKVVQLHLENGVPTLDTYGELQLGPYMGLEIGQVAALETKKLSEAIVDIIRESGVTGNSAALSISYASSFVTTLTIDALDDADITNRIPVEARKYIPVALNEVTLDWFALAQDPEEQKTTLMLVAIHNKTLKELNDAIAGAGLTTAYTELEPFSGVRSSAAQFEGAAAFIDFGADTTKLYITKDGGIEETHSIRLSGEDLTRACLSAAENSFAHAEELKRGAGIADQDGGSEAARKMRDALTRGLRELDKVIDEYEKLHGAAVPNVTLLGSGALLRGLPEFTRDALQREVRMAHPFSKVAFPAFLEDTLKEIGPAFAVALGVALRTFGSE